jgi:hypothetical protein
VAVSLDLQRSPRATLVLRALARVELAASLDSSAAAEELLREPAWRWLEDGAPPRTEDASLGAVTGALLSARAACSEHSREALCVRDLTFPELIQALQERGYRPVEHNMQDALTEPADRPASSRPPDSLPHRPRQCLHPAVARGLERRRLLDAARAWAVRRERYREREELGPFLKSPARPAAPRASA